MIAQVIRPIELQPSHKAYQNPTRAQRLERRGRGGRQEGSLAEAAPFAAQGKRDDGLPGGLVGEGAECLPRSLRCGPLTSRPFGPFDAQVKR
jgi:hypothetical protein